MRFHIDYGGIELLVLMMLEIVIIFTIYCCIGSIEIIKQSILETTNNRRGVNGGLEI